jgi:hypothetical protein
MLMLITLLNTSLLVGLLGAMAPKAKGKPKGPGPVSKPLKKPSTKSTSKKEATTQDQVAPDDTTEEAASKKKKQSNLVTQLKTSAKKLMQVKTGDISVDQGEQEQLEARDKFYKEYSACSFHDKKKSEMLDHFEKDRSCKSWATYKHTYEQKSSRLHSVAWGHGTESSSCHVNCMFNVT